MDLVNNNRARSPPDKADTFLINRLTTKHKMTPKLIAHPFQASKDGHPRLCSKPFALDQAFVALDHSNLP